MGFPSLGPVELLIILGLGVLLFGKRLPEVGRSLGKGIVEFKKGLKGVEEEIDDSARRSERHMASDDRGQNDGPRFDIPSEPRRTS